MNIFFTESGYLEVVKDTPNFIGTVNPDALKLPSLSGEKNNNSQQALFQLTRQMEKLHRDISDIQNRIDAKMQVENPTPFYKFKRWVKEFEERIGRREDEVNNLTKRITGYRDHSLNTFIEVEIAKERTPDFDPVSHSLLVVNQQREFFRKEDLIKQNAELKALIEHKQHEIMIIKGRLKLFDQFQSDNSVKYTINSLKSGNIPQTLVTAAPAKVVEIKAKNKMLKQNLASLIKIRKMLSKERREAIEKIRTERKIKKAATDIQRVFRGYTERRRLRSSHDSATVIQKHVG